MLIIGPWISGKSRCADIPDMSTLATIPARRGRRCDVCALPSDARTRIETALAQGMPLSRISRSTGAPSRDSLRRHIASGHLAPQLQQAVERLHGLDATTVTARIVDAARRAREISIEAFAEGDRTNALRAIDTEMRSLAVLSTLGVSSETEAEMAKAYQDTAKAVFVAARQDPAAAEAVASELYDLERGDIAEDLLAQISNPETNREVAS